MSPWQRYTPYLLIPFTFLCVLKALNLNHQSTAALYSRSRPKSVQSASPSFDRIDVDDNVIIGDQPENIFYFVQISDLHISVYDPMGHTPHFLHFLSTVLPQLSPPFVLTTGDLTDAKDSAKITSSQIEVEWLTYQRALTDAGVMNRTDYWYDLRGNHDCFNVPNYDSKENFYARYGVSRDLAATGKAWVFEKSLAHSGGRYAFVGLDACPRRGPSRPFNFFGYMDGAGVDHLEQQLARAHGANHTFMYGHYPTTTVLFGQTATGKNFKELSKDISVYLCGHLHELVGGIGKTLKSRLPNYLELELSDMKMHASYRILAVDHDLISYADLEVPLSHIPFLGRIPDLSKPNILPARIPFPPIVLVTNPKDSRYMLPQNKEPAHRIKSSSHIRMLAFTDPSGIDSIEITIDGVLHPSAVTYVGRGSPGEEGYLPLFVSEWNPSLYDDGMEHVILVTAKDSDGKIGSSEETVFRVDGEATLMNGHAGEWIIASDITFLLRLAFTVMYTITVGFILLVPKLVSIHLNSIGAFDAFVQAKTHTLHSIHHSIETYPLSVLPQKNLVDRARFFAHAWHLRLSLLSSSATWYLLYYYGLWLITLPWFWAEFIPAAQDPAGREGLFYLYGLYQSASMGSSTGTWLPLTDTWMYSVFEFGFGYVFWVLWFALVSIPHPYVLYGRRASGRMWYRSWLVRLAIVIVWVWRAAECVALAGFYGGVRKQMWRNTGTWWLLIVAVLLGFSNGGVLGAEKSKGAECTCLTCEAVEELEERDEERRGLLRGEEDSGSGSSRESSVGNKKVGRRRRGVD